MEKFAESGYGMRGVIAFSREILFEVFCVFSEETIFEFQSLHSSILVGTSTSPRSMLKGHTDQLNFELYSFYVIRRDQF